MADRTYRVAPHPLHKDAYVLWADEEMGGTMVHFPLASFHSLSMAPSPRAVAERIAEVMDTDWFWDPGKAVPR